MGVTIARHALVKKRSSRLVGTRCILLLLMVEGFAGCASYRPTETGFLTSYAALTPDSFHVNRGLGLQRAESFEAEADDLIAIDS